MSEIDDFLNSDSKTTQRAKAKRDSETGIETDIRDSAGIVTLRSTTIRTLNDALDEAEVDLSTWEVERHVINKWDSVSKINNEGGGTLAATELWQVKIWLRRKTPEQLGIDAILAEIRTHARIEPIARKQTLESKRKHRRHLEISIMDPHVGLRCFHPESNDPYNYEQCADLYLWALDSLIRAAEQYAPFEAIVWPFGNDFLHVDNVFHTTTKGTPQPDSDSWHHIFVEGKRLAITAVERMRKESPVIGYVIPGNHDRQSTFALGHVLEAYFHSTDDVSIDCSASPYKFHHFGCNLIGFEHGHSVNASRLPGIMSNEAPKEWAATHGGYREWHLGDQHRKGSGKPSTMEEQGVSVEYLPALTPANGWHKINGFNWQKRGAMAWVWDHDLGPIARLQVNLGAWKA